MATEFDSLPLFAPQPEPTPEEEGHRAAAHKWMDEHPDGMRLFEEMAMQAASRGRRFGAKALAERIRWEFNITRNETDFKVNNSYVSWIARELIRRHPHLSAFIELRRTRDEAA